MALAALSQPLRERFQTARDLLEKPVGQEDWNHRIPTRVEAFDRLLVGGLARGELVELIGYRSSGRFSLVLTALATATCAGEPAALIDLGDHFDPQQALTLGTDLERLLWLRPRNLKEALRSTEILITGGFPLVVLDMGMPPVPGGRGAQSSWQRLGKAARDHRSALLVSAPYRSSGTAATAVVETKKIRATWRGGGLSPRLLECLSTRMTLCKARGRASGATTELHLQFDTGAISKLPFFSSSSSSYSSSRG